MILFEISKSPKLFSSNFLFQHLYIYKMLYIIMVYFKNFKKKIFMIRHIQKRNFLQEVKKRVFVLQFHLISSEKQMSLLLHLLLSYVAFLPLVSIMFIESPFIPEQVNLFFKAFLFIQLPAILGFHPLYILYGMTAFLTLTVLLFFLNLPTKPIPFFTLLLRLCLALFTFFIVPFANYLVTTTEEIITQTPTSTVQLALKLVVVVEILFLLLFSALYLFLKINPFRKSNITCNYNNNLAFYGYLLDISRVFILTLDSPLAVFPIISLVMEFYKREIRAGHINEGIQEIHCNTSNFVIATHLAVIFVGLTGEKLFGFCLYCLLLIGCLSIGILRYLNRAYEKLLPRCTAPIENFYDFYYQLVEDKKKVNIGGDSEDFYSYYFDHALECKSKSCQIKRQMKKKDRISMEDITYLVGKKISTFQNENTTYQVMLDVWHFEQGKKNIIKRKVREYSIQDEFIIEYLFYLMNFDSYEEEASQEQSENTSKDNLQKEIYQSLIGYEKIYEELIKTHPHFQSIIQSMLKIRSNIVNAKEIFNQLLKSQEINYNVISIYFIFFNYFLGKNSISPQIIEKLQKNKFNNNCQDIHEFPVPTLLFHRETSNIEDLNIEALRFMRARKVEIKRSLINQFFAPPLNLEHLITSINKSEEDGKILFFKKLNKQKQQCLGYIEIQTLELNSAQHAIMKIYKKSTSRNQLQLLVNNKFKLIAASHGRIRYNHHRQVSDFKVEETFQPILYDHKEALQKTKLTKIQIIPDEVEGFLIEKDSILKSHKIISLKLAFLGGKEQTKRRNSYTLRQLTQYNKKPNYFVRDFMFTFEGESDMALFGKLHQQEKKKYHGCQFAIRRSSVNDEVFRRTFEFGIGSKRALYSKGIKSYRLYEGELYNIDLEDRQKYNELFGSQGEKENQAKRSTCGVHQNVYISITIFISLALFVVSLLLSFRIDEEKVQIKDLFQTTQELNLFALQLAQVFLLGINEVRKNKKQYFLLFCFSENLIPEQIKQLYTKKAICFEKNQYSKELSDKQRKKLNFSYFLSLDLSKTFRIFVFPDNQT